MSKRLKVSLLVWNLSTNDGVIRASLLGEALKRLGYTIEVVGFEFGEGRYKAIPSDLAITSVKGYLLPSFVKATGQLLPKIDGDIIYAIKPQLASFGVGLLKRFLQHRPLVLDIDDWELSWHGGDDWRYRPGLKQFARDMLKPQGALRRPEHPLYVKWLEGWVKAADAVTVHTSFMQQRFGGILVPNGKDTDLFDPARYDISSSRQRYGLSNYRILMFPGAPRPSKGLEDVLTALEKLNQPDLRVAIVGGSPYDNYDQQLIAQWGKWIIKLPNYPAEVMPEIVAAADVVVVPQRDNPTARAQFPLKLTDGMAMAKPVLATRVGDIPEILADTGYLVDPSSPEQLQEQIQVIFENLEEAQARGQQARARCVKFYSIEAMVTQLARVFANLGLPSVTRI